MEQLEALDGALAATWYSGTMGEGSGFGPSTMWIDALVELPASRVERLREQIDFAPAAAAPDVVDLLPQDAVAQCKLRADGLDAGWSLGDWNVRAYLCGDSDLVLIEAVGG